MIPQNRFGKSTRSPLKIIFRYYFIFKGIIQASLQFTAASAEHCGIITRIAVLAFNLIIIWWVYWDFLPKQCRWGLEAILRLKTQSITFFFFFSTKNWASIFILKCPINFLCTCKNRRFLQRDIGEEIHSLCMGFWFISDFDYECLISLL